MEEEEKILLKREKNDLSLLCPYNTVPVLFLFRRRFFFEYFFLIASYKEIQL